jgi:hypothetical protein
VATQQDTRARALVAIGALAAFGLLIGVVVAVGAGSGDPEVAEAPDECVESWNDDPQAVNTGVHNFSSHGYASVQVAYASEDGTEVDSSPVSGGGCVVVFPAQALDPEPVAAAEINLSGEWVPLSATADTDTLARLQSEAISAANASLLEDGRLSPLSP